MDDFIADIVRFVLEKWDKLPPEQKDKVREELINTFISFIGDGKQHDKKIIGVHLN